MQDKYPWLDSSDERKCMSDKEILDKYVDVDKLCLTDEEKKQVMDMLYKCKDVFSLRDEIGTCPNKEVEIEVKDKSPFFIRPYHVKEEDTKILDKEMKRLCYLGILKEGFSFVYISHSFVSLSSWLILWNRTFVDIRLAFIQPQLDFIRSEGEMKFSTLYML